MHSNNYCVLFLEFWDGWLLNYFYPAAGTYTVIWHFVCVWFYFRKLWGVLLDSWFLLKKADSNCGLGGLCIASCCLPVMPVPILRAVLTVTHSLVTSHLDFFNVLYMGLLLKSIRMEFSPFRPPRSQINSILWTFCN